ncbi:MAG: phosphoribosylglycinamide formyltransferase [Desulfobacterales bacterium]
MIEKIRIGALISGKGSNLQAIMDSCENGQINGQVVFIGSDNPRSEGLKRAVATKIPTFVADYTSIIQRVKTNPTAAELPADFDYEDILARQTLVQGRNDDNKIRSFLFSRAIAEAQLLAEMANCSYDLLVLAGFMRTLTPYFIDRVNPERSNPRIMNIHPALLPAFPGTDGYGDTFRYGCKVAGCTVHFIDYGEDTGPIIGQRAFAIAPDDSLELIRKKGLKLEWQLYPECIQLFAEGRLQTVKKTFTLPNGRQYQRTIVEILPESSSSAFPKRS